jgi:hypothetical protein
MLGFSFGNAKLGITAGRTTSPAAGGSIFSGNPASNVSVGGVQLQPMLAGRNSIGNVFPGGTRPLGINYGDLPIDQMLGATFSLPLMKSGSLNLAYLWLDSNNTIGTSNGSANRTTVFGGDAHFSFGNFLVNAGYSQSNLQYNSENRVKDDNKAWYANVGLDSGRWGANVEYRSIDPLFAAPGDWGRIGMWWNPVDIEGIMGKAHFNLNDDLRLVGTVEGYRGRETDNSILSHDDELRRYTVGVEYKMASNYDLALGVEDVRWDLDSSSPLIPLGSDGKVTERWYNLGFGWSLSDNAKLKFLWQVSDYKALQVPGFSLPFGTNNNPGQNRAKGGLITTQLSVKF